VARRRSRGPGKKLADAQRHTSASGHERGLLLTRGKAPGGDRGHGPRSSSRVQAADSRALLRKDVTQDLPGHGGRRPGTRPGDRVLDRGKKYQGRGKERDRGPTRLPAQL